MKNKFFIILPIFLLWNSGCEKTSLPTHYKANQRSTTTAYTFIQNGDMVLMVPTNYVAEKEVFILKGNFQAHPMEIIPVISIVSLEDQVKFLRLDGSQLSLSINPNSLSAMTGHSLIQVSGTANQDIFYNNGVPKPYPDISYVKCGCVQNGTNSNCTYGGNGSTECSAEINYAITGGHHLGEKCSVKCGSGYYSCCNK